MSNYLGVFKAGKTIFARAGDYFDLMVEENPSTGYTWRNDPEDFTTGPTTSYQLPVLSSKLIPGEGSAHGAPQQRAFRIKTEKPGPSFVVTLLNYPPAGTLPTEAITTSVVVLPANAVSLPKGAAPIANALPSTGLKESFIDAIVATALPASRPSSVWPLIIGLGIGLIALQMSQSKRK